LQTPLLVGTGLFILAAVVWVVCAIYAYRLAPTYGRGAWPWAIAAIFLGPFALFALVLLPKRPVKPGHGEHREDPQAALYERPRKR
jgi:ATP/ADP translocase